MFVHSSHICLLVHMKVLYITVFPIGCFCKNFSCPMWDYSSLICQSQFHFYSTIHTTHVYQCVSHHVSIQTNKYNITIIHIKNKIYFSLWWCCLMQNWELVSTCFTTLWCNGCFYFQCVHYIHASVMQYFGQSDLFAIVK